MIRVPYRALAMAACFLALPALSQTLYKLVSPDGKVTYSNEEPKDFKGTVTRITVDPNANTATMPKFTPGSPAAAGGAAEPARAPTAKEKAEKLRKDLEFARANPGPDDVARVGNVGGGTRPVPTEAYARRLAAMEAELAEAEAEVRRGNR